MIELTASQLSKQRCGQMQMEIKNQG